MNQARLQQEIDSIVGQIIAKYKPGKIILFGSAAKGEFSQNSDLDFLVVKNDNRRPLDVEQELHKIIDYQLATDFLFLSESDYLKRLNEKDFFLQEVTATGRVLYG